MTAANANTPADDNSADSTPRIDSETRDTILEHASELSDPRGPLFDERDDDRVEKLVKDLHLAVHGERAAEGDLPVLTEDGHPDDDAWTKHTDTVTATADFGIFHAITDDDHEDTKDVTMRFQIRPSNDDIVNLEGVVEGTFNGLEFSHGGLGQLTPKQAEGLAAALVEAAAQARQGGAYDDEF